MSDRKRAKTAAGTRKAQKRPSGRRGAILAATAIAAITIVAYSPTLHSGFIWDDDLWLTNNHAVRSPEGLSEIWSLEVDPDTHALRSHTTQYYPLVFTTYWLENRLWGLKPLGYHLVNVLLHLANAILVWLIARRLQVRGAWLVGALFALHPVQVESVAWITQRRNVLSGLFYLLAIREYLDFDDSRRWGRYALASLFFLCAVLSKTVTVTLPVVLLLILSYRRWRYIRTGEGPSIGPAPNESEPAPRLWRGRPLLLGGLRSRDLLPLLPLLLFAALMGTLTAHLELVDAGAGDVLWRSSFLERAAILAPSAFCFYAGKIIWPHPVIFVYPRWQISAENWLWYLPLLVVVVGIALAIIGTRRASWRKWYGGAGIYPLLFAGVTLLPALGLFKVYYLRYSYVADHWQYLGGLGFLLLCLGGVDRLGCHLVLLGRRSFVLWTAAAIVLVLFGGLTFKQCFAYRDAETIWRDTLRKNPGAWIALNNLGVLQARKSQMASDEATRRHLLDEATSLFERASQFPEARAEAAGNLANVAYLRGDDERAARFYEEAIRLDPNNPGNYGNLRSVLEALDRVEEAAAYLERSLNVESLRAVTRAEILRQLASARMDEGRLNDAVAVAARAIALEPALPGLRTFYAALLLRVDRPQDAVVQLGFVKEDAPDYLEAQRSLVNALFRSGRYADAMKLCRSNLKKYAPGSAHEPAQAYYYPYFLADLARMLAICSDSSLRDLGRAQAAMAELLRPGRRWRLSADILDAAAAVASERGAHAEAISFGEQALASAKQEGLPADVLRLLALRLDLYRQSLPYHLSPRPGLGLEGIN